MASISMSAAAVTDSDEVAVTDSDEVADMNGLPSSV